MEEVVVWEPAPPERADEVWVERTVNAGDITGHPLLALQWPLTATAPQRQHGDGVRGRARRYGWLHPHGWALETILDLGLCTIHPNRSDPVYINSQSIRSFLRHQWIYERPGRLGRDGAVLR